MTQIVLLGDGLDRILIREPFLHQVTKQQRLDRYTDALSAIADRGELFPYADLRARIGCQYQAAWRAGRTPNLRFIDLRRTPLESAWDPARRERRAGRDASYHPRGQARGGLAAMVALIAAVAAFARCRT